MPRYRKLSVNILSSPDVDAMPDDFTRLVWTWLPLICTRDGTGLLHTTLLKSQLFPMRQDVTVNMIDQAFSHFEDAGLITIYEVDGRHYFFVRNFAKYQGVTTKETPSPYPSPPTQESVKTNARVSQELVLTNSRQGLPLVNMNIAFEYDDESESESDQPFRVLFDAFLDATGIAETMLNLQRAVDVITKEWLPANVTVDEVKAAAKALQDKGYNITGPWSLTNTINMMRSSKKKGGARPGSEYKLPDDYDNDEDDDDDTPEVNNKWQLFVQDHVKDRRWQNLLEYAGEEDGKTIIHVPETELPEAQSRFEKSLQRYYMGNVALKGIAI